MDYWRKKKRRSVRGLALKNASWLRDATLLGTTVLAFIVGAVLVAIGIYVIRNMGHLVENNLDPTVKRSNLTRTLVARYGAIVPNKDYIPVKIDVGPWLTWVPLRVLDMGVALMAFSAFGLYAVTSRKPLQIYLFIAVLLAAVIGQIIFLINMLDLRSQFHRRMRQSLSTSLRTRYEFGADAHDTFTYIMNGVMLMGECCGINGPHDFTVRRNHYIHTTSGHVTHNATVVFPLACCHRSYIERGFHSTLDCALSWSKQAINTEGCYKTVYAYMSENFGSAIVWIYVVITYVELMQILLCLSQASEIAREKRANKLSSALRRARLRQRSNCMIVQNQLRLVHTDV